MASRLLWALRSVWSETNDPASVLAVAVEYGYTESDIVAWPADEYNSEVSRLNDPPPYPDKPPPGGGRWTLDHKLPKCRCRKLKAPPYKAASRENLQWLSHNENIEKGTRVLPEHKHLEDAFRSPRVLR